ncbi:uncharacterized protein LOC111639589 [Centruroides sculpturatus]|uniref:uncharacterized protein LOC111639589 n=1 Tax=Centruroides sculpturatus TaxID=218467 RepID=UPI000C6D42B9|nr:uncharacterized protein LOC111639589 [Centruroides sculpturatus]
MPIIYTNTMENYSPLLRSCLIYINSHLQDIINYYRRRNVYTESLFSVLPPILCELLLNFAPSDLDPQILCNFFRKGIKTLRLAFYNHDIPIRRFSEFSQEITHARFGFSNITQQNLGELIRLLPNVSVLSLCGTNANDSTVETIGKHCPLIECLDLSYCLITDVGLSSLCYDSEDQQFPRCKYLKVLKVKGTVITVNGLVNVLEYVPLMKIQVERNLYMNAVCHFVQRNYNRHLHLRELCLIPSEDRMDLPDILLSFPELHTLCIYKLAINETDLINTLSSLLCLNRLSISIQKGDSSLTFEGISCYLFSAGKQLTELKLNNFEYVNLYQIGTRCTNLRILGLYSIRHLYFKKDDVVEQLDPIFQQLERLNLENIRGDPWDDCLSSLFSNCSRLNELIISSLSCLNDDLVLEIVPLLKTVQTLALHNCENVNKWSIYCIIDQAPSLKSLWMIYNRNVLSEREQAHVRDYIKLKNIGVRFHYWEILGHFVPSDQISITLDEMQF